MFDALNQPTPSPARGGFARWLPFLLLLLGYAALGGSHAVGMLIYATHVPTESDGSELLGMKLAQLGLAWLGPLVLLAALYLVFARIRAEGAVRERGAMLWRFVQMGLILLTIPGIFMLIPAVLMLREW